MQEIVTKGMASPVRAAAEVNSGTVLLGYNLVGTERGDFFLRDIIDTID